MRRLLISCLAACAAPKAPTAAPVCGDAVIASQADVARLAGCTMLHDVTIRSGGSLQLASMRLATVTGALRIGPTVGVEDVTLPQLREVRGELHVVGNGLMQGLFLRQLQRAAVISIDGNAALTTIGLPALTEATALRVTDNASLELLDVAALTKLDELVVRGAPRLDLLDAPQLRAAGRVELEAPRVPAEVAEALRQLPRVQQDVAR